MCTHPIGIRQIGAYGQITKHTRKQVTVSNRHQKQEIAELASLRVFDAGIMIYRIKIIVFKVWKEIKGGLETISKEENTAPNGQADLKKNQVEFLEMKNVIIEMKNSVDRISNRSDTPKEN